LWPNYAYYFKSAWAFPGPDPEMVSPHGDSTLMLINKRKAPVTEMAMTIYNNINILQKSEGFQ
jgi:hypothetical protein